MKIEIKFFKNSFNFMSDHAAKTSNTQKNLVKKYKELFRFVERTGEEVFVFPKEYKVGISLKPVDVLKKEIELKDTLDKIQRGKKEYSKGRSEEFESFLKKKYPQYAKNFSKNLIKTFNCSPLKRFSCSKPVLLILA